MRVLMLKSVLWIVIALFVSLSSCENYAIDPGFTSPINPNPPQPPNIITMMFKGEIITLHDTWRFSKDINNHLINFDIREYPDAISIVFAPVIASSSSENYCFAELYNVTDSVTISRSPVKSNIRGWTEVRSNDLYENLPRKRITLAIRLRSETEGVTVVSSTQSCLRIFLRD